MSRLDKLISELCPDGVEYKTLGEIATEIYRGSGIKRSEVTEIGIPCVRYGEIYTTYDIWFDNCVSHTDESMIKNGKYFEYGDVLFAITGESVEDIAKSVVYVGHERCMAGGDIVVMKHNQDPKYLAYVLSTTGARQQKSKGKVKSKVVHSSVPAIKEIRVPVPPLEVQREIVRILDSFTLLTAELTAELIAELTARKKQYEYYRDELLKPQESIPMVTLKEISTSIYRGAGIKRDQVTEDGVPCVRYGEIYTTYNTWFDKCLSHTKEEYVSSPKYFEHGDILFAITGESVDDIAKSIAYVGHDKCLAGGDIVVMKHQQNPRYLAHVLNTSMAREQKSKGKVKSKVVHSNVPSIEQIRIPLPSLEVQKRYADVLDNFEQICSDLNIGLPAEIEARKKQYEYYRDVLLTFVETGTVVATDRQTDRQ